MGSSRLQVEVKTVEGSLVGLAENDGRSRPRQLHDNLFRRELLVHDAGAAFTEAIVLAVAVVALHSRTSEEHQFFFGFTGKRCESLSAIDCASFCTPINGLSVR